MIKIAYIIDTIETPCAGTEKQLLMLLNGLDKTKFKPYLICLRESEWIKKQKFSFPVIILNLNKMFSFDFLVKTKDFIKLHKKEKFDIAQTFFVDANIFGTIAAKIAGVKTIISNRRNIGHWHSEVDLLKLKLLRSWTTHYLANSYAAAKVTEKMEKVRSEKITVIYNGLELEKFNHITKEMRNEQRAKLNIKDEEILAGLVANLRKVKNIKLFIEVAFKTYKKYPFARFIIVGDGPDRKMLESLIEKYSLSEVAILSGQQKNIIPFLSAMDIAVLCSKSESLSNSIMEYMAAGLPSVVSDVGDNSEIINGNTGLIFKSEDVNDFFQKLEKLITQKYLRTEIGIEAKKYAKCNFDSFLYIKRHEQIYERYYVIHNRETNNEKDH